MPFELAEPRSLREAIASLDAKDPSVRPISGGTALMLMMKAGMLRPSRLVSLGKLGLAGIRTGRAGERSIPVEELGTGYLETSIRLDELITLLEVPPLGGRSAAYLKCTTRSADDWPAVGVAVSLDFQGDSIREASVVIGAATDKPTRLAAVERILVGRKLDENLLDEAATQELSVEGDLHGSAAYKKQLIRVYLRRAIHEARAQSR